MEELEQHLQLMEHQLKEQVEAVAEVIVVLQVVLLLVVEELAKADHHYKLVIQEQLTLVVAVVEVQMTQQVEQVVLV
jgi:hypothetical protein